MSGLEILLVISVVTAVASTAISVQQAEAQKDAADKRQEIEEQRVALEAAERDLRRQNELSALRRQARVNRAIISNRNAAQNVRFTTPTAGALGAVRANLKREFEFSEQTGSLAAQGDAITLRQIGLETGAAKSRANAAIFSAVVTGIGSAAAAGYKANRAGVFDSNDTAKVSDFSTGTGNVITP